jgi:hypothetical protein
MLVVCGDRAAAYLPDEKGAAAVKKEQVFSLRRAPTRNAGGEAQQ